MQPKLSTRLAFWRRIFRLYRRQRHGRVIHPKAQIPVDTEQVRELADALQSPPDSTRYKLALMEAETFGFLIDESLALVDDGLRLHKVFFERAHSEPALAELVSKDINGAPMNRLLTALIKPAVLCGANRLVLEREAGSLSLRRTVPLRIPNQRRFPRTFGHRSRVGRFGRRRSVGASFCFGMNVRMDYPAI